VGGGIAVVVFAASLLGPAKEADEQHPPELQPVVRTALVCPFTGGRDDVKSYVGVLAIGETTGADVDGENESVTVTPLSTWDAGIDLDEDEDEDQGEGDEGEGDEGDRAPTESPEPDEPPEPLLTIEERGVPGVERVEVDSPTSFAVEARGTLAAGTAAETSTLVPGAQVHGFSSASCSPPGREHWFVGGSGSEGKRGTLVLSNPSDVSAVVDVDVWAESGPVDAAATQDVNVPPKSQRVFLLDALAPEAAVVAVHVSTERGKVSAAVEVHESAEAEPRGLSYLPAASEPSTELLIPGVPKIGNPTLMLFAPGETDAIVSLTYQGEHGSFTPASQSVVTVPSGEILSVPLEGLEETIAVAVSSDEPVTAGVRVKRGSEDGFPDIAFSAAAEPLSGPAAALLGRSSASFTTSLSLSSVVDSASRATIQTLDEDGAIANEQTVDVPARSTVQIDLERAEDTSYPFAVVRPADPGSLVVTRQVGASTGDGSYIDVLPLTSPVVEVQVPEVVNELPEIPDPEEDASES
jgi:hypothetical protein